ncbi:MAG: hypothetical protein QNK26_07595, partial [Moritella sp.]|uniref:hypothetical protein n=1 Tax=Moritella sp. TaxID=78556 RepID=UPI0029BDE9C3
REHLQDEDHRITLQDAIQGTASGRRPKDYVTGCNTEINQDGFIVLGRQKDTPMDWEVEI